MANFTRTQLDATWVLGYQVTPADLEDLARKCVEGVNGTVGGVYAPTAPIVVNGAGLLVSGPTEIKGDGRLRVTSAGSLVLGDDDFQDLMPGHPGRTRTIWHPMAPARGIGANHFLLCSPGGTGAVQAIASTVRRKTVEEPVEFLRELRVHNGATMKAARVRFRITTTHFSAPAKTPKFRVFRLDVETGVHESMSTTALGDGFVSIPAPSSGAGWTNGGLTQEFSVPVDTNNVIDSSKYLYFLHVVDEVSGIGTYPYTVDVYEPYVLRASVKPNALDGTVDGSTLNAGAIALFKDETDASYNGLWVAPGVIGGPAAAGAWTSRAPGLSSSTQFKQGMVFYVTPFVGGQGKTNQGSVWQMFVPPSFTLGASPIQFLKPVPNGTMFVGVAVDFDNITSTRFQ